MSGRASYAAAELKAMLPYLLAFNAAAVIVAVCVGLGFGFEWQVYTGLVTGNALMAANFLLIGVTADKIVKVRDFRRAKQLGSVSYALRYIGIFAILAGLLTIRVINPVSAVVPLFYPKIYYTFFYIRSEKEDKEA
ncbi:MAG: ATP synthase subunit I [Ruminiclostridium sp.]|nr:ATP synthase subunit I [Ruminiclostridium sp.]